jgi:hypothetical protein
MRERRLLTNLVHGLVLLYLGMCLFVIATYGASAPTSVVCDVGGVCRHCRSLRATVFPRVCVCLHHRPEVLERA